ncbi:methyltransferase domain-containing protein [Candidatus Parcubacteria bacterium]|nr:MAG: methyltransferase domain-containing protein [Candidatus Parcubacteria bacterium]
MRRCGVRADLIYRKEDLAPFQNVLLSHFDEGVAQFCKEARKQGKTLLFCHTESLQGLPYQNEVFNLCDYIICCSTVLAQHTQAWLISPFTKCIVIPDMAEGPFPEDKPLHQPISKENLTVSYVGMGGNSYLAKRLKPIIEGLGMKLIIISEHSDADIKWNRDTYLQDMANADIAICPQNWELQPAKSNVKVSLAMALGIPVIASPIQAYKEIIEEGVNGFIATTDEEWKIALTKLKNYRTRISMSKAAWETGRQFWPERIAEKYRDFLLSCKKNVAFVNNTLPQKYLSYGDQLLETLRFAGRATYEEFRYEDIDCLPHHYDMHIFVEVRYNPEDLAAPHYQNWWHAQQAGNGKIRPIFVPRVLITKEDTNLNNLPHFNLIITPIKELADKWQNRGFVNAVYQDLNILNYEFIRTCLDQEDTFNYNRRNHNLKLHDAHINEFHHLIPPEERWTTGNRDKAHIEYTMKHTQVGSQVLDIGSADGWLSLYLAKEGRQVSALEFVKRGMDWMQEHAKRLGVNIDLRKGFIEDVDSVFEDKRFDTILIYELLEHLDFWRISWYLNKVERLLKKDGQILISLPKQDLNENIEHLWSPNEKLIKKIFQYKPNIELEWTNIPNHGVPGVWFIRYTGNKNEYDGQ